MSGDGAQAGGEEVLLVEVRDQALLLTINRPRQRNALTFETSAAIAAAMDRLDAEDELRVGILTGAGDNFSAGMDLKAFAATGSKPVIEGRGLAGFAERPPRKPLIAAIEGYALAGGFEAALACDLIVASREARFGLPEVRRGLLAAGGGLVRLPRRMPLNLARELALTGAMVGAERMAEHGVVNRLVAPGAALEAALELATTIAANAPLAVAGAKRMLALAGELPESEVWAAQRELNAAIGGSEDALEGARAFAEKRPPVWQGR